MPSKLAWGFPVGVELHGKDKNVFGTSGQMNTGDL